MKPARMPLLLAALTLLVTSGCEVTLSAYIEKDWRTDPRIYDKPDAKSRVEIKVSKLVGKDARKAEPAKETAKETTKEPPK